MKFALSTRWNARRHHSGEKMIEEILQLGFDQVELGYNIRSNLVPGVKKMVEENAVEVVSVHNFCPVPAVAAEGHPELYTLTSKDKSTRESALTYISQTIRFASEVGAKIVVLHCGNVEMKTYTSQLVKLFKNGKRLSNSYEKVKYNLFVVREKNVKIHLTHLLNGLTQIVPLLEETGVRLGLENLPSWEAIPTEVECLHLIKKFGCKFLCYWHDLGHAQIRESLGLIHHQNQLKNLYPFLGGMHIHDMDANLHDHVMPPSGVIDFSGLKRIVKGSLPKVFEPSPRQSSESVQSGLTYLKNLWGG